MCVQSHSSSVPVWNSPKISFRHRLTMIIYFYNFITYMANKPYCTSGLLPRHSELMYSCGFRVYSRCVYLTWSFFYSQKLKRRRLVTGLKQQDFHSMLSSMKVTHGSSMILFSCFTISFSHPLSLHPHFPYCVTCCGLFSGLSSCAERWVMGKAFLSLLGLVLLFSIFLHLSPFWPCPWFPSLPFRHSPHRFPVWFGYLCTIKDSNMKTRWQTPLFVPLFFLLV